MQFSLGVAHFNAQQYQKAVPALEQDVASRPDASDVRRMLSLAYLNAGIYDKAAELLRNDPGRDSDPSLQYAFGVALARSNRPQDAWIVFSQLLEQYPDMPEANVALGQANAAEGDYDQAVQHLQKAIAAKPDVAEARGMTLTVLQLVANRWWTGSADPVIQLVRGLRARELRVMLGLIAGDRFEVKAREADITPLAGLSLEVGFHPVATAGDVLRLRRLIRRDGVDIVHVHHSHDHWLGEISRGSAALVRTFHNQGAVRGGWPDTALYRRADALVAMSGATEERCRQVGVSPDRLFRLEGVAAVERFSGPVDAEAARRELGLGRGPVVGSVARLADRRGHGALVRGFQRLLSDFPDARLVLVGKGEARPRLERLVSELGVERAVVFAGCRDADLPTGFEFAGAAALDQIRGFVEGPGTVQDQWAGKRGGA